MEKRPGKLKADIVLKNYWRDNAHFADFFNAVLFDGRQIIKPDELESEDTEVSFISEHKEHLETIEASRDVVKVHKRSAMQGVELVLLGMEAQEHIHYAMPMRVMGYDYSAYRRQYSANAQKHRENKDLQGDEYLSGMGREDKFIPIITVVVYYGEKPWDGAVSLWGILSIPQQMRKFVNDYKMWIVEARQNSLVLHNMDNKDLFNLLEILLDKSKSLKEIRNRAIEYTQEHKVDMAVVMTVAGATNNKVDYDMLSKKGDADMCTVFEETWEEGKAEGKAEGIIVMGLDCGLSEDDVLEKLQEKLNIPLQKAQEYFCLYAKQTV